MLVGIVWTDEPDVAAAELAAYRAREVIAIDRAGSDRTRPTAAVIAGALAGARQDASRPSHILLGATPDGRDVAGILSALLGWGVLVNATAVDLGGWLAGRRDEHVRWPPAYDAAGSRPTTASSPSGRTP